MRTNDVRSAFLYDFLFYKVLLRFYCSLYRFKGNNRSLELFHGAHKHPQEDAGSVKLVLRVELSGLSLRPDYKLRGTTLSRSLSTISQNDQCS